MRIRVTYDVSDIERRAIRWRTGQAGLASRSEVIATYDSLLDGDIAIIINEFESERPSEAERLRRRYEARRQGVRS